MIRSLAATAAVLVLAACGSSASPAASSSPPAAAPTASAAPIASVQVIDQDRVQECIDFTAAYSTMHADTSAARDTDALIPVVMAHNQAWMRVLSRAVHDSDSAPEGRNAARNLAVRIAKVNAAIGLLGLYAVTSAHNRDKVWPTWAKVTRQMNSINAACA